MIQMTNQKHEGLPVYQVSSRVSFSDRLVPAFVAGKQIGFLREQSTTTPRNQAVLTQVQPGFSSYLKEVGGIIWTGD